MTNKTLCFIHYAGRVMWILMLSVLLAGCELLFPRITIVPHRHDNMDLRPECVWTQARTSIALPPGFSTREFLFVPPSLDIDFWLSLAVDHTGIPYLAYPDKAHDGHLTVMKYEEGSWVAVGKPGFSAKPASYPSLTLDAAGAPQIAYMKNDSDVIGYVLAIKRFSGNTWEAVEQSGTSLQSVCFSTLALDATGVPHVAYMDIEKPGRLTVMKLTGDGWVAVGPPTFLPGMGKGLDTVLALNKTGTPYVVYQDYDRKNIKYDEGKKLSVMKLAKDAWVPIGSLDASTCFDCPPALAVDAVGTPYVAYTDWDKGLRLTVKKFTGSEWVTVGSPGFTSTGAGFAGLSFSPNGVPYVAYLQLAGNCGYVFDVKKFVGDSWIDMDFPGAAAETNTSSSPAK